MVVTYGEVCPDGYLPAFSVGSTEEAKALLIFACPTNHKNQFIAPELSREQTLENLNAFAERLNNAHKVLVKMGKCTCTSNPTTGPSPT